MRSSWLIGALCAAGALAAPLEKRVYVTDVIVVTVTETIYPTTTTAPAPPPPAQAIAQAPAEDLQLTSTVNAPPPPPPATTSVVPLPIISSILPPPATSAASSTAAPAPTGANAYQSTILENHNIHRANHSAAALTWSSDLESSAQALANGCVYQHDTSIDGGGYGQNIGYGIDASDIGVMITNLMYNNEEPWFANLYGQANPDMTHFDSWGHFSQIVWKGTTQVGCATVVCPSLGNAEGSNVPFTVCNYGPPGNFAGEYADNISPPIGNAIFVVS